MHCLMIFDHLNDIIFNECDKNFLERINNIAKNDHILNVDNEPISEEVQANILIHLFSPVITSQRIMMGQFGNSYTFIKCYENMTICMDEYMGFLFVYISNEDISNIKRYLNVSIAMTRYLCGPDVYRLKDSCKGYFLNIIDCYRNLYKNNSSILIEAIEQINLNSSLSSEILKILNESVQALISKTTCTKLHALILVQNKFLSLYSSPVANELSPIDILFATILCESQKRNDSSKNEIFSCLAFLYGNEILPKCIPHMLFIIPLNKDANLIFFLETGNISISSSLYETFCHFHAIQIVQIQRDEKLLKIAYENLEIAVRKLSDGLKKNKDGRSQMIFKDLTKKWDVIKKKYVEFFKTLSEESLLRAETLSLGLLETLKSLLNLIATDEVMLRSYSELISVVASEVTEKFKEYSEFILVKSEENLTIEAYIKEFPGLVHFIYVDRNTHKMTSPDVDSLCQSTELIDKNKIWKMVNFSLRQAEEGALLIIWKDFTFCYTHFIWFENLNGSPLKPLLLPSNFTKTLLNSSLFQMDFYQKLKEICFPKMLPSKIKCYELFCVHLGLVTSTLVLEHTRRLAATIWELNGPPPHSFDLL